MTAAYTDPGLADLQRQLLGPKVAAAVLSTLSPGTMSSHCAESFTATMLADARKPERERRFARPGGGTIMVVSGPRIAETRSRIVDTFRTSEHLRGAEWLVMIDSDMVFRPHHVDMLLDTAHRTERPIVGGLCFAGLSPDSMYPTVYDLQRGEDGRFGVKQVHDYPRDQVVKVGGTGAAFLAVHRDVFDAMIAPHPAGFGTLPDGTPNVYPWFVEGHTDPHGRPFGEDIAFCIRANALGFPVHVDTRIKIGHHKGLILDEDLYDRVRTP